MKPFRDKEGKNTGFLQLQEVLQAFGAHLQNVVPAILKATL